MHDISRKRTAATDASQANGVRILVVEDEFLLACSLEDDLRSVGHAVIGPYAELAGALEASRAQTFDLAILDINLNGELAYPLVDELAARGIPLLILSGYGAASLPERLRALPRLAKPYDPTVLMREIRRLSPAALRHR